MWPVGSQMALQVDLLRKGFAAVGVDAGKGSDPFVNAQVHLQVALLRKSLVASRMRAGIRPVSRMVAQVDPQGLSAAKALGAAFIKAADFSLCVAGEERCSVCVCRACRDRGVRGGKAVGLCSFASCGLAVVLASGRCCFVPGLICLAGAWPDGADRSSDVAFRRANPGAMAALAQMAYQVAAVGKPSCASLVRAA